MSMTAEKTVRELALENTTATRVFEKLGIDYCCLHHWAHQQMSVAQRSAPVANLCGGHVTLRQEVAT